MSATPRTLEALRVLHRFIQEAGWAPTLKQWGSEMGVSFAAARWHLQRLEALGYVFSTGETRCLRVTADGLAALGERMRCVECATSSRSREAGQE